jgi:hypothetical protein
LGLAVREVQLPVVLRQMEQTVPILFLVLLHLLVVVAVEVFLPQGLLVAQVVAAVTAVEHLLLAQGLLVKGLPEE